jgi:hypothetical protein
MNKHFKLKIVVLIFLCVSITNLCSCKYWNSTIPKYDIPQENINTYVKIFAPKGWNEFIIGDPIAVVVDVIGKEILVFPADFNIQCFTYTDSKWSEIEKEQIQRLNGKIIMFPSKGKPELIRSALIFPKINDQVDPLKLRVVIVGHIYIDGKSTDQLVGAYTDVKLYP